MSCSPLNKSSLLLLRDKEGKKKREKKEKKGCIKKCDGSHVRSMRRKLSKGMSPLKAEGGDQPRHEQ